MDISRVLALVRPFFDDRREPYAIVGGLALLAYGAPRATFDVDLLARRETRNELVEYFERHGFRTLGVQPGFSNHQHEDPALGRAMKTQAFANDQSRYSDLADLQYLLKLAGLDLAEARGYFEAAGLQDYYERLRQR